MRKKKGFIQKAKDTIRKMEKSAQKNKQNKLVKLRESVKYDTEMAGLQLQQAKAKKKLNKAKEMNKPKMPSFGMGGPSMARDSYNEFGGEMNKKKKKKTDWL